MNPNDDRSPDPSRRAALGTLAAIPAAPALLRAPNVSAQSLQKVLRYAFPAAETGMDPAQVSDLYSRIITGHLFDSLLAYDHFARPARLRPLAAEAMPDVSSDYRTYTFRLRRGVLFHDDAAFKGRPREMVAQDFVFALKRFWDPRWKSPIVAGLEEFKFVGLNELRQRALKDRTPFPYDVEVDGLRALDRYTLQIRLAESAPHFTETMAQPDLFGAVAREVVEMYGDDVMAHPVGTGPFQLAQWKRSSRIVLDRFPRYREEHVDGEPPADDPQMQRLFESLKGRRLPLVDRVEVYIVEESQPRWLAFLNGEHDFLDRLPNDFVTIAAPGGKLAPSLARRAIGMRRGVGADVTYTVFNMKHPVIGGYAPDKVALRRAIALGLNIDEEIRIPRRGQAVPAQTPVNPHCYGYDPKLKTEMSDHDMARARALLDTFGYVDRDGDGWRELPDGSPLVVEHMTMPDQAMKQLDEIRKRNLDRLGVRLDLKIGKWPENLKNARAAKFMTWGLGSSATGFDSRPALQRGYGPAAGGQNLAHFDHPEFNRLYDLYRVEPNGPRRLEILHGLIRIWHAYMPYKMHVSRIFTDMWHPWVNAYLRHPFQQRFWEYMDVDPSLRDRSA
jgi:ABC-type transport system substrate-binding protein